MKPRKLLEKTQKLILQDQNLFIHLRTTLARLLYEELGPQAKLSPIIVERILLRFVGSLTNNRMEEQLYIPLWKAKLCLNCDQVFNYVPSLMEERWNSPIVCPSCCSNQVKDLAPLALKQEEQYV